MSSPTEVDARTYIAAWQESDAAIRARLIDACFAAEDRITVLLAFGGAAPGPLARP